jgi:hypothetical protein
VPALQKKKPAVMPGEAPDHASRLGKRRELRSNNFINVLFPDPGFPMWAVRRAASNNYEMIHTSNPEEILSTSAPKPLHKITSSLRLAFPARSLIDPLEGALLGSRNTMETVIQDWEVEHLKDILTEDGFVLSMDQLVNDFRELLNIFLVLWFEVLCVYGIHGLILPSLHVMDLVAFAKYRQACFG